MNLRGRAAGTACALALFLTSLFAHAGHSCRAAQPVDQQPEAAAYARSLADNLAGEAQRARLWRRAWIAINAGLTISSFAPLPWVARDKWPELITSGVGSAISTVLTVAWPLDVEAATALGTTRTCDDLVRLEQAASLYAADEGARVTWPWHLLNVAVGGVYYAIIGVGYNRPRNGLVAAVSAFAIGEVQTLTQPTRLSRRWHAVGWQVTSSRDVLGVALAVAW